MYKTLAVIIILFLLLIVILKVESIEAPKGFKARVKLPAPTNLRIVFEGSGEPVLEGDRPIIKDGVIIYQP